MLDQQKKSSWGHDISFTFLCQGSPAPEKSRGMLCQGALPRRKVEECYARGALPPEKSRGMLCQGGPCPREK